MASAREPVQQAFFGFVTKQERWGLSWRGCFLAFAGLFAGSAILIFGVYPFLATTHRTDADVLVVEGWVHDYGIRAAVREFATSRYTCVLSTGGPVQGIGHYINDYSTSASIGAQRLKDAGIPADRVEMVPSRTLDRDRTFSSAIALREWFSANHLSPKRINVLTEDVHARRTRLLFQMAFGENVSVGIIAIPSPDYDARRWWRYSEGVRAVLGETISYVYAKFFFFPPATPVAGQSRPTDA
jgi:uncharacterized SAM-binding protein YcdF (DUF218 family)